jgi:AmmeMemoRadiSam system protein B
LPPSRWLLAFLLFTAPLGGLARAEQPSEAPYPTPAAQPDAVRGSIESAQHLPISQRKLSGLTVPNDLAAAELIARGFRIAEGNRYDKIVILFPENMSTTERPFATISLSFDTEFGSVAINAADIARLLQDRHLMQEQEFLVTDRGIGAVLPYVRHFFPDTPIVPIAVSVASTQGDWDLLAADLDGVVTAKTLILQTTDMAPSLPLREAQAREQAFLNVLAAADATAAARLIEPRATDSGGAQYLQMRLQAKHFRSRPLVTASIPLEPDPAAALMTSAMVQIYPATDDAGMIDPPDASAAETYCFAGDSFFGRNMQKVLSYRGTSERMRQEVRRRLTGCTHLVVNLEGVMVEKMPSSPGSMTLAMPKVPTLDWLHALNVAAVSVPTTTATTWARRTLRVWSTCSRRAASRRCAMATSSISARFAWWP